MNIGLIYNLIRLDPDRIEPDLKVDSIAEFDSEKTIDALKSALEYDGHTVELIEFDDFIFRKLEALKSRLDIVFNIAEGVEGDSRESQIPIILDLLKIPYTGSSALCLAICLNKQRTKEILIYHKLPTADFCVLNSPEDKVKVSLKYPLIVKLNSEGSSMGLDETSVCENKVQLKKQVEKVFDIYGKQIIIEEYIEGREFTVGLIGNKSLFAFPVIESVFTDKNIKYPTTFFEPDSWVMDSLKKAGYREIKTQSYRKTECPAKIDDKMKETLQELAMKAFHALDCRDWCRIDFRVNERKGPFILELNPIAGIDPTYFFPTAALKAGITYSQLINRILNNAIERLDISQVSRKKVAND